MSALKLITDGYDRKARLYPALVCLAPIVVTGMAIVSLKLSALQSLAATLVGCGGAFLLSQLARDAGKKGEPALFERWAGCRAWGSSGTATSAWTQSRKRGITRSSRRW